jgi:hypothetical protein
LLFRLLLGFNAVCAAVLLYFFFWGLSDGTVSSFNIGSWLAILAVAAALFGAALFLNAQGHSVFANFVLLALALPGFLYGLFILLVIIAQPNWR